MFSAQVGALQEGSSAETASLERRPPTPGETASHPLPAGRSSATPAYPAPPPLPRTRGRDARHLRTKEGGSAPAGSSASAAQRRRRLQTGGAGAPGRLGAPEQTRHTFGNRTHRKLLCGPSRGRGQHQGAQEWRHTRRRAARPTVPTRAPAAAPLPGAGVILQPGAHVPHHRAASVAMARAVAGGPGAPSPPGSRPLAGDHLTEGVVAAVLHLAAPSPAKTGVPAGQNRSRASPHGAGIAVEDVVPGHVGGAVAAAPAAGMVNRHPMPSGPSGGHSGAGMAFSFRDRRGMARSILASGRTHRGGAGSAERTRGRLSLNPGGRRPTPGCASPAG